jgi:hypothetical protein
LRVSQFWTALYTFGFPSPDRPECRGQARHPFGHLESIFPQLGGEQGIGLVFLITKPRVIMNVSCHFHNLAPNQFSIFLNLLLPIAHRMNIQSLPFVNSTVSSGMSLILPRPKTRKVFSKFAWYPSSYDRRGKKAVLCLVCPLKRYLLHLLIPDLPLYNGHVHGNVLDLIRVNPPGIFAQDH